MAWGVLCSVFFTTTAAIAWESWTTHAASEAEIYDYAIVPLPHSLMTLPPPHTPPWLALALSRSFTERHGYILLTLLIDTESRWSCRTQLLVTAAALSFSNVFEDRKAARSPSKQRSYLDSYGTCSLKVLSSSTSALIYCEWTGS